MREARAGLGEFVSARALRGFTAAEVALMCGGEPAVLWDRTELAACVVPDSGSGYTSSSPTYVMLLEEMLAMPQAQRRDLLFFVTGCPRLPPGGLAALAATPQGKIKIVREQMVSARVCNHMLRLPECE